MSPNRLIVGGNGHSGGVVVLDFLKQAHQKVNLYRYVKRPNTSPFKHRVVNCVALDGEKVWVGAANFLARVDLITGDVDCLSEFEEANAPVQCLQLDGDGLWVAVKNQLYRVPKSAWN